MNKAILLLAGTMLMAAGCSKNQDELNRVLIQVDQLETDLLSIKNQAALNAAPIQLLEREMAEVRAELASMKEAAAREAAADESGKPHDHASLSRVAVIDRGRVSAATSEWTQRRIREEEAKEVLTDEQRQALDRHQELQRELQQLGAELMRQQMIPPGPGMRPGFGPPHMRVDPRSDPEYAKLAEQVEEARQAVADILTRRAQRAQNLRYPIDELVREYVQDRFDIVLEQHVLDSQTFFLRQREVVNITQGILDLFFEKEKVEPGQMPFRPRF